MTRLALAWLLLLAAPPAMAAEPDEEEEPGTRVGASVTEEFRLRYWRDDRLLDTRQGEVHAYDYVEQVNRLGLHATAGEWSAWAQVDQVALLANRFYLDDELVVERDLVRDDVFSPLPGDTYANLEKLSLRRETSALSVSVGDFYAAFGRGAALNVARNVDIDIDTSIQGAKVVWRPGAWDLTGLVGQLNRQQVRLTLPNRDIDGDYRHAVGGLRAERYGLGPANVGVHGVAWSFVRDHGLAAGFENLGTTPDAVVGGATVELLGVGGLDWYAEGDVYGFPTDVLFGGEPAEPGYALYASSTAYLGHTVWLLEGKRYLNAERLNALLGPEQYEVAVGPTLEYERAINEDSAAAVNSNDVYGGRLQVDWAISRGVVPRVALAVLRDRELGGLHFNRAPETIVHPLVGLELTVDHWAVLADVGYRVDARDGSEYGADRQLHGDLDFKFPLGHGWLGNVQSAVEHYRWGVNAFQQSDYLETENSVALQWGSDAALIAYCDYSDNPLVDTTGNLSEALYGGLELQVKPTSAFTVKAFYGANKAGIRCSGGQCRLVPGFEGAKLEAVGTF